VAVKRFETYGARSSDLLAVGMNVSLALGCVFQLRYSEHRCGAYFLWEDEGETVRVSRNLDPYDDEPARQEFPDFPILIEVEASRRAQQIKHAMLGLSDQVSLLEEDKR
jgi:hypothetical protein